MSHSFASAAILPSANGEDILDGNGSVSTHRAWLERRVTELALSMIGTTSAK
jgi:hypothetical protein